MDIVELFGAKTGNCFRAAIALEEAGIPYHVRRIDLSAGEHKLPDFLTLNSAGQVPILIDHSHAGPPTILTQSNAIVMYAADRAPNILLPRHGPARSRAIERFFFFLTDVIGPRNDGFLVHALGEERAAEILAERALNFIAFAEGFLASSPFMAGDSFTIADIMAITIVKSMYLQIPWLRFPQLRQWFFDVSGRPGVVCGFRAFDLAGEEKH